MDDIKSHRKSLSCRAEGILFLLVGSALAFTLGLLSPALTILV